VRLLFSHTNYPAQFRRLVPALVEAGHDVVFLAKSKEWHAPPDQGFRLNLYQPHRSGGAAVVHPYLRRFEQAVLEGQACYRSAIALKEQGWQPDWIVNHVGYGNGLYLSDAFPSARRIGLFEWYYNAFGSDVDFLTQGVVDADRQLRLRTWNAQVLLELAACDHCVTPTQWQRDQFPDPFRERLTVIHEGIDVDHLSGLRSQGLPPPVALPADPELEVITYVSRCFEEYRGFPQVMRVIEELQRRRPHLHVLIAGYDGVAYGAPRNDGRSWGDWAREACQLDPSRTHWLGMLQDQAYWQVLANSTVHLYLTVPFVLSWSLLEAMAAGCAIVASATPPVQEVLSHEESALLVDFFAVDQQVQAIEQLLDHPARRSQLAAAAQRQALRYGAAKGLEGWRSLLGVTAC
jgi:glycosyltransferase involved in cell wall biosynthesis